MSKVWFLTGSSSGAEAVLVRGDRAVLAARRRDALEEIVAPFRDAALAVEMDATVPDARARAVEGALKRFGRIDVLANIAGRGSLGAAEEFSVEQLREQMELFAAAELARAVLPIMRAQGSGHILNLTSIGGLAAVGGFGPYCASKFALEGWTEALRDEVKPLGIHVTIVEPGAFRTEFAGAKNMRPARQIGAYRPVIEPVEHYLYGSDGKQPGDAAKAARVIVDAIYSDDPPLRLMLGVDAIGLWEKKRDAIDAEVRKWRSVAETTTFDGATAAPVGG